MAGIVFKYQMLANTNSARQYENLSSYKSSSSCHSCKCANCQELESCPTPHNSYLTCTDVKPPVPCRPKRTSGSFSPEKYEYPFDSKIQRENNNTKKNWMRRNDIQMPLPDGSATETHQLPGYRPRPPNHTPPPIPHSNNTQRLHQHHMLDVNVVSNDRIAPSNRRFVSSDETNYTTPITNSDLQVIHNDLEIDSVPAINESKTRVETDLHEKERNLKNGKEEIISLHSKLRVPSRKSARNGKQKRTVKLWTKIGSIVLCLSFVVLVYFVIISVKQNLLVHHKRKTFENWFINTTEPLDSQLDTTVCFPCEFLQNEYKHRQRSLTRNHYHSFQTKDETRHCCLDQLGYLRWMINVMTTRHMLVSEVDRGLKASSALPSCGAGITTVPIYNSCPEGAKKKAKLNLKTEILEKKCGGAHVNVTSDYLMAETEGTYIVYLTMTMQFSASDSTAVCSDSAPTQGITAHLYCGHSPKEKCIEMETSGTRKDSTFHVFNFLTVRKFQEGEIFYPVVSHPSHLFPVKVGNYIGIVRVQPNGTES